MKTRALHSGGYVATKDEALEDLKAKLPPTSLAAMEHNFVGFRKLTVRQIYGLIDALEMLAKPWSADVNAAERKVDKSIVRLVQAQTKALKK